MPLYSIEDLREDGEMGAIDALLEAGLLCVLTGSERHVEVRGYGKTIKVEVHDFERGEILSRHKAITLVQRVVFDYRERIRKQEEQEAMERWEREKAVESEHD